MEVAINSSEVMLSCERCKEAIRISHRLLEDGTKVRVCKECGEVFQNLKGGTSHE